jgi:hypothetical protein
MNRIEEEMIVVTGYKRSGTSLMMALVEKMGVDLHYCQEFEEQLRTHHGGKNNFYYEDSKFTAKKVSTEESLWYNGAVKMFSHVVTHNVKQVPSHLFTSENVKVIWMWRDPTKIERSIRRYKKPGIKYTGPGGHSSSTLEDELEIIGQQNNLLVEAIRELPQVLTVDFDDLLQDPAGVGKRASEFIGRPFNTSDLDEYLKLVNSK